MTTTLSEGVKVPDVGSVNWAGDLEINWNLLNGALANLSGNVKLDRDNTWTGEQSFTLPIVGSLTGTASKAIADEDGTSIKTGYVNVAGNQTVTGDKSFTGSNTFNNILPNATNSYSLGSSSYQWSSVYAQSYFYNGTAWGLDKSNAWGNTQTVTGNDKGWNIINPDIEKGVIPSANKSSFVWWADKNNNFLGRICSRVHTDGTTMLWLSSLNYYKNGALDPTGSSATTSLILGVDANAYKFVQTNADFRPDANNTSNLGTSTNQWKSVYAQTYYYNGTAWGLDQNNRWSAAQFYSQNSIHVRNVEPGVAPSSDVSAGIRFENANASYVFADIVGRVFTSGTTFVNLIASNKFTNGALDPNGTTISRGFQIGLRADGSGFIYTDCGWRNNLIPHSANTGLNLGTSTNKWKTLNGVNPGALSFPDGANYINVGGSILPNGGTATAFDGSANYFTPTITGWLSLAINSCSDLSVWASSMRYGQRTIAPSTRQNLQVMLPVFAGQTYEIYIIGSSINTARLFPCLGNV